jgi:hypothetical protein
LTDPVARRPESQVLQMIYKFYWFLPALEDIYRELSETPNWLGCPNKFICDSSNDIQWNRSGCERHGRNNENFPCSDCPTKNPFV